MSPKTRIRNHAMRDYVAARLPYSNVKGGCYGHWNDEADPTLYVVVSYGWHHPLYIYDPEAAMWFGNTTKRSPTTSQHARVAYPTGVPRDEMHWLNNEQMCLLVHVGSYAAYCGERIAGHPATRDQTSAA